MLDESYIVNNRDDSSCLAKLQSCQQARAATKAARPPARSASSLTSLLGRALSGSVSQSCPEFSKLFLGAWKNVISRG